MAAESLIQSVIKCPICLEAYTDPRMLPCLHSFCQGCLNSYIENVRMGPTQHFFTCPVCREEIYPPHPYRPLFQWSVQFRSNFIMTDLASCLTEVAKGKEEGEGGDARGEVCFPCSKQMPFPKEADHFCLDCSHPYCEACIQVHMSIPSCQKHSIVSIGDEGARRQHKKQHQHCGEHPEEVLKMFCEDCNVLLCPMCALMNHRQCSKLNSVTPMAEARRLHLETSQRTLQVTLTAAREKQARLRQDKETLDCNITVSLRDMDEAYDSLITRIKEKKRSDMLRTHEAIARTQKHMASCEEQIAVFIRVLEENISKTQSQKLITSDVELLQEVSKEQLGEAESDVAAAAAFLSRMDGGGFEVPGVARERLAELKQLIGRTALTTCDSGHALAAPHTAAHPAPVPLRPSQVEHSPAKLSAVGGTSFHPHPHPHSGFALQLQQERLACVSVMSTSSDISAASTSSSEGSMACGHSSDGQRNPFSLTSFGKKSIRRPTARPRNSLARRALAGASVFSVKHPVVTAANSPVKQAPPKVTSSSAGFVFVPAKSVSALFSQFRPIPKVPAPSASAAAAAAIADPIVDPHDVLLDIMPPHASLPMSGSHTLPRAAAATGGAEVLLASSRGTNTQHSGGQTLPRPPKAAKGMEPARKSSSNALAPPPSSSSMVSPRSGAKVKVTEGAAAHSVDHSLASPGAAISAEVAASASARASLLLKDSPSAGARASLSLKDTPSARATLPAPVPARASVPAPVPARAALPAPVPARASLPAPVPARASLPAPVPARASLPAPVPARASLPAPVPARASLPAPVPARASLPAPVPARASLPAPVPARASLPAPVPARASLPAPVPARASLPAPVPARASLSLNNPPPPSSSSSSSVGGAEASASAAGAEAPPTPDSGKLRSVFKICPSSAGDLRRPIISDFAVLPNGRLAVVDRANSRVKVVVLSREGQDGLCPCVDVTKPHGVCHMSGEVMAVVSHVAKTLQLVSVGSHSLTLKHIHNTCRGYLSIARLSPTVLAARFSLGVHVLDVGGAALRLKTAIVNDAQGKPLFQSPSNMCTTTDGKIVILDSMTLEVSCWESSGGAPLWRFVHNAGGPGSFPRSVCSVGLRRLYILTGVDHQHHSLHCLNAASGKLLHSLSLEDEAPLKEVSTMLQDGHDRILINNHEEIVCFDWV